MQKHNVRNKSHTLKTRLVLDYCEDYWCKLRGLAWQRALNANEGIILAYAKESKMRSAIHMLGMFFDLAIIWLDMDFRVVDVRIAKKWRSFITPQKSAAYVIECSVFRAKEFNIGDQIAIDPL